MVLQQELKVLLEKYNASIVWTCGESSDMHGIYGEQMVVFDGNGKTLFAVEGGSITAEDLK